MASQVFIAFAALVLQPFCNLRPLCLGGCDGSP